MHAARSALPKRGRVSAAMLAALVLLPLLARLGRAAAQGTVPGLEELGSDWVDFGTGATVPTQSGPEPIPIDCPSISNVFGSVGSCEPGCPDLLSFNSWTAGPYQQGTCAARVRLDGVPVNVSRHQWLPYQVVREGTAGRFSFTSAMRMLEDAAGTPGILLNLTVTSTAGELGRDGELAPSELKIDLAPELQLLSDMPWNINWPPAKAGWTHTVEQGGRLLLSRDTTTQAVTALGIMQVAPSSSLFTIVPPTQHSVGLGAHGPAASVAIPLVALRGPTTFTVFVVAGNSTAAVLTAAAGLSSASAFASAWAGSRDGWSKRWQQAFEPSNAHYSGHFPTMKISNTEDADAAAVARIYYAGCVTLLACERNNYPAISPRVYLTGFGTLQPFMGKYLLCNIMIIFKTINLNQLVQFNGSNEWIKLGVLWCRAGMRFTAEAPPFTGTRAC